MENIRELLMSHFGYSEQDACVLCNDLEQLDQALVPVLTKWIKDSDCSDSMEYSGYSINSLCAEYGMNFIAALLTLDWIIKEPEQAIPAIKGGIM